jgi:hypothetical protein
MKDNLKKNSQKYLMRSQQLRQLQQLQQSRQLWLLRQLKQPTYLKLTQPNKSDQSEYIPDEFVNNIISLRKIQSQIYLERRRLLLKYKNEEINQNDKNNVIICKNIGNDSGMNKDTPFISYLIDKRINFCELGASSHIAAFVPVTCNFRFCFLRDWKWKDHYG